MHFHTNIMRHSTRRFNYRGGSIGNFFFAGTRIFFRWVQGAGVWDDRGCIRLLGAGKRAGNFSFAGTRIFFRWVVRWRGAACLLGAGKRAGSFFFLAGTRIFFRRVLGCRGAA